MADTNSNRSHGRLVRKLGFIAVAMFGFGFALVPLYNVFCDAFGINGRFLEIESGQYDVNAAIERGEEIAKRRDDSRMITVQFTANRNQNLPWEFHPTVTQVRVNPGEIKEVTYYARNLTDQPMIGQAVPSVAPGKANKYFTKMECFCFAQQLFEAGEGREMPLRFVVDPDLPQDVNTITLAYTFFESPANSNEQAKADRVASAHIEDKTTTTADGK